MGRQQATLLGVVACLSIAGCSSWVYQRAADHREANPYEGDIPVGSGQSGREFFDRRLRDIVIGIEVAEIETDDAGVTTIFAGGGSEEFRHLWFSATPVSQDGYALTSIHQGSRYRLPAGRERLAAVLPREPGDKRFGHPVWVWCAPEADVALVKVEGIEMTPFAWSEDVSVGQTVYLGGVRTIGPAEGTIVDIDVESGEALPFTRIVHTAPARDGDSGGALVDAEGKLLGINVGMTPGLFRAKDSRIIAIRPDRAALERIIAGYEADPESAPATYLEACSAD